MSGVVTMDDDPYGYEAQDQQDQYRRQIQRHHLLPMARVDAPVPATIGASTRFSDAGLSACAELF
jgi:hypothetical protein